VYMRAMAVSFGAVSWSDKLLLSTYSYLFYIYSYSYLVLLFLLSTYAVTRRRGESAATGGTRALADERKVN
jgi:hypothetical protein